MGWRLAKSLETLRDQVNAAYPGRNKTSDGTIGDARHASSTSDHNPNPAGVVTAIDITHDPAHGVDIGKIAETLRLSKDPRIKYVICNGRIFSSKVSPWVWRQYTGTNAHSKHIHVSVDAALYDDARPWPLPGKPSMQPIAKPPNYRSLAGGFFSADPFDTRIPTSIRTNNPGALNASPWVKKFPGYVGDKVTSMSGASSNNTAIFETPEHGVAAWWQLMANYRAAGAKTVEQIINKYGGTGQDYSAYIKFVVNKTGMARNREIKLSGDDKILTAFAKSMWHYEAGRATPLSNAQIAYGFNLARNRSGPLGNAVKVGVPVIIVGGGTMVANEAKKAGWKPVDFGMIFVATVILAVSGFLLVRWLLRK